jgi:gluconolactonase
MGDTPSVPSAHSRRTFLHAALAMPVLATAAHAAQQAATLPPAAPRDWSGSDPIRYPDPDIIALDPRFRRYVIGNTTIQRLHTGTLWAEGPAWNAVGRYLLWSDIPNNVQLRWVEDDGRVTVFRSPSGFSNGNTFDRSGRQIACEHGNRRVARYEHDGTVTTIADRYQGKRLNSPNDAVVHPDGSIWFTDPMYGIRGNYEGYKAESETKPGVYRVDPQSGQVALVSDELTGPNGLCFSPDYKRLYVADTGSGRDIRVLDVDGATARNLRRFAALTMPGAADQPSAADGMRCDVDGNIWAGARPGVQVIAPDGVAIGAIRLPENCANVCFGGARRNRLFMTASQSLYAVYVDTQGAI